MPVRINPSTYVAMKQWLQSIGSFPYYIEQQQQKAADEGAPLDALFERATIVHAPEFGKWITVRDLAPNHPFRLSWEKK